MLLANLTKREFVDLSRVHRLMRAGVLAVLWGGEISPFFGGWWVGDHVIVLTHHNKDLYSLVLREYRDITGQVLDALCPVDLEEVG
ncbi:MAG: hypothetical protein ACO2PP_15620 [Thermocrinis sp.]|jgi:hypothetical protein|uniref:hypothetical protein n=1 Tax=Thermocrinis sp. TaxID=2024383 RepID=UPI003C0009EF